MSRILTLCVAVALTSLALVTTSAAATDQQVATRWAHFNRLLNPPAGELALLSTSAVPPLRGYHDFGLTNMQPAVVGAAVRPTSQAVAASRLADTSAVPPLRGFRDFGFTKMQPAVIDAGAPAASEPEPVSEIRAGGFDWADAGVGAAAMFGLVLVATGLGAGLVARRHTRQIGRA